MINNKQILVNEIKGPDRIDIFNKRATYRVVKYSEENPAEIYKNSVMWSLKIGDNEPKLLEDKKGEFIEIDLTEDMVGKSILVIAWLEQTTEKACYKTLVTDVRKKIIDAHGIVPRDQWGKRKPDYPKMDLDWNYHTIAIHHLGDRIKKNPLSIEKKHIKKRKWGDIGYHYMISDDGTIYEGRQIYYKGSHVYPNTGKIGIVLMGDFQHQFWDPNNDVPTETQLKKLEELILTLKNEFPTINTMGGHRDLAHHNKKNKGKINCPGDELYKLLPDIRKRVKLNEPSLDGINA